MGASINFSRGATTLLVGLALTACGGGGGDSPQASSALPTPAVTVTHQVSLLAGKLGGEGYLDGPASEARFASNSKVEYAQADGSLIVSDANNSAIRRVTASGQVETVLRRGANSIVPVPGGFVFSLGSRIFKGTPGTTTAVILAGDTSGSIIDGVGTAARFGFFNLLAVAPDGVIYAADNNNKAVRKILADGTVSTLAGNGDTGFEDGTGSAARFQTMVGIAVDASSNVYVLEANRIRKVTPAGVVTTFAGSTTAGALDGIGVAAQFSSSSGLRISSDGTRLIVGANGAVRSVVLATAEVTTLFRNPVGITNPSADGALGVGNFQFSNPFTQLSDGSYAFFDIIKSTVRKLNLVTGLSTVAGVPAGDGIANGAVGTSRLADARSLSLAPGGGVHFNDGVTLRKLSRAGVVSDFSTPVIDNTLVGTCSNVAGDVYGVRVSDIVKYSSTGIRSFFAGDPTTTGYVDAAGSAARFSQLRECVVAADGTLYVGDQSGKLIRKITAAGLVTTLAGNLLTSVNTAGTGAAANFDLITSIAINSVGNLVVASRGDVMQVSPLGVSAFIYQYVAPAPFAFTYGLALDASDNIYYVDGRNRMYRINSAGGIVQVADFSRANERLIRVGDNGTINQNNNFSNLLFLGETASNISFAFADGSESAIVQLDVRK